MTSIRKKYLRIKRGKLEKFEDLPEFAKNNFILIKKELTNLLGKEVEVSIYGSFHWGDWCEDSDYDVVINEKFDFYNLVEKMKEKNKIRVDFFLSESNEGLISVP
jgi:predicted nucleotidyltransferase